MGRKYIEILKFGFLINSLWTVPIPKLHYFIMYFGTQNMQLLNQNECCLSKVSILSVNKWFSYFRIIIELPSFRNQFFF